MLYSKGDDEKGKNIRYFREMTAAPRAGDVMVLAQGRAAFLRQGVEGGSKATCCLVFALSKVA